MRHRVGRHDQQVGGQRVGHPQDAAAQPGRAGPAIGGLRPGDPHGQRERRTGPGVESDGQRRSDVPAGQFADPRVLPRGQQRRRGGHGAAHVGDRRHGDAQLLRDGRRLTEGGPGAFLFLRDEQPGAAHVRGDGPPQAGVVRFGTAQPGQQVSRAASGGEQRAQAV
jgi:hypothetical protein